MINFGWKNERKVVTFRKVNDSYFPSNGALMFLSKNITCFIILDSWRMPHITFQSHPLRALNHKSTVADTRLKSFQVFCLRKTKKIFWPNSWTFFVTTLTLLKSRFRWLYIHLQSKILMSFVNKCVYTITCKIIYLFYTFLNRHDWSLHIESRTEKQKRFRSLSRSSFKKR